MEKLFVRAARALIPAFLIALAAGSVFAQAAKPKPAPPAPKPTPVAKGALKPTTADGVVETSILLYAYPGGRATLNQIRKTTLERGRSSITGADGHVEQNGYQRYVIRAESLDKEKIRLDQDTPKARFSLVFNDAKIFGIYNNTVFTPREDALKAFENQIFHGTEAMLRYKENGSTLELASHEKISGVDYYIVDVTDKQGRKTRFYVSAKSFRILMLTYDDGGVKYKRRFYNYNYAQGTLVPFRSVLWAGDKIVEESDVLTVTFGQKVDEELFKAAS